MGSWASYQRKAAIDFTCIEYWMLRPFVLPHNFVLQNLKPEKMQKSADTVSTSDIYRLHLHSFCPQVVMSR